MQIIFFSSSFDTIDEFKKRDEQNIISCYDIASLDSEMSKVDEFILIVDYNSVATEFNKLISSNILPKNTVVLEKNPEIITGKMLISHNVKAYGNIRMSKVHYTQLIQTVINTQIWTYPELTVALVDIQESEKLSDDSESLIQHRLTSKEKEVVYLVLKGLTNDAIASKLNITSRTVKSHISSIFTKLHVNDRVSLILLLK